MSPKQRYQAPRIRKRSEIWKAVGAAAAVVVATALMVWLLRPGPDDRFDGGGGGLFNRQPRASWLVGLTLIALVGFVWWVFTRPRRQRTRLLVIGAVMILIIASISGFFWPGGLLRQYQTVPEFDPSEFEDPTVTDSSVPTDSIPTDSSVPPDSVPTDSSVTPDTQTGETTPTETTPATGSP